MEKFLQRYLNFLPPEKKNIAVFVLDVLFNIIVVIGVVVFLRALVFSPFRVSGPSMCNTLNFINERCEHGEGEYIIVSVFDYQNFFGWQFHSPKRGDIIVFQRSSEDKALIKRIIGLPGETVKLIDGQVYIVNSAHPDGFKLFEPYLNSENQGKTLPYRDENLDTFVVPAGHYFVMGDNRAESTDSRSCFKTVAVGNYCHQSGSSPFIDEGMIQGKAAITLWPISKIGFFLDPDYSI